ncbi:MAG TPA: hypothetical protein VFW87_12320 [Pirellulales bacterium]|nr:hypothetical protein [Pirellulales bacterium]
MLLLSGTLACLAGTPAAVADDAWQWSLPEAGAEHEYPPLRAIPLASGKPDGLKETVQYRGASRRYAQLRYGSPSAARVAIVVDQVSPGEVDLYVDANRNRTIEADERCQGEGRLWRVPMNVEYAQGEVFKRIGRALVFRLGSTGRTLSYSAAGYLAGQLTLDDGQTAALAVRRMDGDGNGFFTDPQDRLWIDLNRDGRWDPLSEQFLYTTIVTIADQRYAVRSDERGTQLKLSRLEGTGTIQLALPTRSAVPAKSVAATTGPGTIGPIADIAVTLVGRDGSAVALRGPEATASVPIGEYRISAVAVTLDDPGGGPRWNFVFSDNLSGEARRWYPLQKDVHLAINPLERFDFSIVTERADGKCRPGEGLVLQPKLLTADGLLINTCYRGTHETGRGDVTASLRLAASDGAVLSMSQSGFA